MLVSPPFLEHCPSNTLGHLGADSGPRAPLGALVLRACWNNLERPSAKIPKSPLSTGQHDYLEILRLPGQGIKHSLDAVIIRKDNRIIEDYGCRCAASCQQPRKS